MTTPETTEIINDQELQSQEIQNEYAINNSHISEYIRTEFYKDRGFFITLPDIGYGDMFKPNFSNIEYEISREAANDPVLKQIREGNVNHSSVHFDFPSHKVLEIANIHKTESEYQKEVHDTLKAFYKEHLPIGNDSYTSGGTHFHIFIQSPYTVRLLANTTVSYWKKVQEFLFNLPLYAKPWKIDNTLYFVNRYNRLFKEVNGSNPIQYGSKSNCITLKRSYYGSNVNNGFSSDNREIEEQNFGEHSQRSIEFRLNNIVDERIAGYYIAALLYPFVSNELGNVRKIENKKDIFKGSYKTYPGAGYRTNNPIEDTDEYLFEMDENTQYDAHLTELIAHEPQKFKISRRDKLNIAYNIGLMEEILTIFDKPKALEMIRSYISEHDII